MLRAIIVCLLSIIMSACYFAPGMKMRNSPNVRNNAATEIKPRFIPIDVALVRRLYRYSRINQDDAYYYHVGAHDVLNIHVWGHPELNGPMAPPASEQGTNAPPSMAAVGYLVNPDGDIFYPMVGTVHVAGKTVDQSRSMLTRALKRYIRNPQMDVRVIGFRSKKIYVMGEVAKPGLVALTDSPMSITDAINIVGGLDQKTADPSHIFVIRGDYARPEVYWLDAQSPDALLLGQNFRLKAQDVVFVSTAGVARWNRAIEQILPTIQTAWFSYQLVQAAR